MSPQNSQLKVSTLTLVKTACSNCNLRELCLPFGLEPNEMERLDTLVSNRRRLKRGEYLYRVGDTFDAIFAIRSGFFKTDVLIEDGRDQVTGFQMGGELLGLDGISTEQHTCNAIALEDSDICAIPFSQMEALSREIRGYSHAEFFLRMTREEIGSYLGLKLETVSRTFSRFQEDGHIAVQQKHIRILDVNGLKALMNRRN